MKGIAIEHAKKGIAVFPCKVKSKMPATAHGHKDATTDLDQIEKWWTDNPNYNIGAVPMSGGYIVLDCDIFTEDEVESGRATTDEKNKRLQAVINDLELKHTRGVGSYKGYHLWYQIPEGHVGEIKNKKLLGGRIDVRGSNGYVMLAGSIHPNGCKYEIFNPHIDYVDIPEISKKAYDLLFDDDEDDTIVLTNSTSEEELDALLDKLKSHEKFQRLFDGNADGYHSNSEADYALICILARHTKDPDAILEIFIKSGLYRPAKYDENTMRQQIIKAIKSGWTFKSKDDVIEEFNREFAVIPAGSKVCIMRINHTKNTIDEPVSFWSVQSFNVWHANKPAVEIPDPKKPGKTKFITATQYWLKHKDRRSYEGIIFAPNVQTMTHYNLWEGYTVLPDKTQSCDIFLEHILKNVACGDDKNYNYIMAWLSDMIQNPCDKPGVALVLQGNMGAGKTVVAKHVGYLLGRSAIITENQRHVFGNFNSLLSNKLLLGIDEAFWAGDHKLRGQLMGMITSDEMIIERKGFEPYKINNYLRFIITGNPEWLVPVEEYDRRFAIFAVGDGNRQDHDFFCSMNEQLLKGGYSRLLYELLNFETSQKILKDIPSTDIRKKHYLTTLNLDNSMLYDIINEYLPKTLNDMKDPTFIFNTDIRELCADQGFNLQIGRPWVEIKKVMKIFGWADGKKDKRRGYKPKDASVCTKYNKEDKALKPYEIDGDG